MGEQGNGSPENLSQKLTAVESRPERERTRVDYLVICGQGPVQEKGEKVKVADSQWVKSGAEIGEGKGPEANSWMKFISYAAGEIYQKGLCGKVVLTGGKTGGEGFPSEAELMKKELVERYHIPEGNIILEDKAGNTLQNFALSINGIEKKSGGIAETTSFGVLAADFHAERTALLANLFGLKVNEVYSAEETLMTLWGKTLSEGSKKFLLARVTPEEAERLKLFASDKAEELKIRGQEGKSVKQRSNEEKRYSANLVEVPAYWIGYVGLLENEQRIREILTDINKANPGFLEKAGLDLGREISEIKETLKTFTFGPEKGGKRECLYEETAKTGEVPPDLMGKIKVKIPLGAPVLRSVYY